MFTRVRKQTGQRVETKSGFFIRLYVTTADAGRKKATVKIADKTDVFKTWDDVEHLVDRELAKANGEQPEPRTLSEFVEEVYLPWADENLAPVTAYTNRRIWLREWKALVGDLALGALKTATVTTILTGIADKGKSGRTLSHAKWMLSGVYEFALQRGLVEKNPVADASWQRKVKRPVKQVEYSLEQALAMLEILGPIDLRAAVAVGLGYFAALRPAEIRGLMWSDYDGEELQVRRSVWRQHVGETKTVGSERRVLVIEPLRSLLEKLRVLHGGHGYVMQNANHQPLCLNSLNCRVIAPALKNAGLPWRGYYPGRRGMSSLMTATFKQCAERHGLLGHSTAVTTHKHYTQAQVEAIRATMRQIEEKAIKSR